MKNFKNVLVTVTTIIALTFSVGCTANTVDRPRPSQPGNEKVTTTTGFVAKNKAQQEWLELKAMATREGRTAHFDERFGGIMPKGLTKDSTGADLQRYYESIGWPSVGINFIVPTTMEEDIKDLYVGQVIIDPSSVLIEGGMAKLYVVYEDNEGHLAVSMPIEVGVHQDLKEANLTFAIVKLPPKTLKESIIEFDKKGRIFGSSATLTIRR